jgi:hypothetical protein
MLLLSAMAACLGTSTPTPTPTPTPETVATTTPAATLTNEQRLARPVLDFPLKPSHLYQGRLIYWGICLACHGDCGQGLID